MNEAITIEKIRNDIDQYRPPHRWFDPAHVHGIDRSEIFNRNEIAFYEPVNIDADDSYHDDDAIADHLRSFIIQSEILGDALDPKILFNAAMYMITGLGSGNVAHTWTFIRKFFNLHDFSWAFHEARAQFAKKNSVFVKILLADFFIDFFPIDDKDFLTPDKDEFFDHLFSYRKNFLLNNSKRI